jgi:hypothetical protein
MKVFDMGFWIGLTSRVANAKTTKTINSSFSLTFSNDFVVDF